MQTVLIIIHLLVTIALVIAVLLQRSEGGALGIGGGGGGGGAGMFSARGAANTLTRTTVALGILFFSTSMALTMLVLGGGQPTSILDTLPAGQVVPPAPVGGPPALPGPGLPGLPGTAPGAPAVPDVPSVPPLQ